MGGQGAFLKNYFKDSKNLSIICFVLILISSTFMMSINAQTQNLVFFDNYDDYIEKVYSGGDGPGIWYQSIGGGGTAEYKIAVSGGEKYYNLKSTGGVFVKSILAYYIFGYYVGPNDYYIESTMKIVKGEGGLIFRISTDWKKYYLATVYKDSKKVVLWYVNEDEGPGAGPKFGEASIPATVDLGNWFSLRADVYKNNITIYVEGEKLISILDSRLTSGGVGLYTYSNGEASFNSFMLVVLATIETTTTTKTVTSPTTTTKTVTTTSYQTTTITGLETTLTQTETMTITSLMTTFIPATSLLETTVTEVSTATIIEAETTTKTEIVEVTKTAPSLKETVTTTVTQGLGLKCLIATAAYGSEVAPQVQALREFRDNFVMKTFAGSNFMTVFNTFYYSWSPYVAKAEYENPALRDTVKLTIYPLISLLEFSRDASMIFSDTPELAVLISGLIASSLITLIYLTPIALITYIILRLRKIDTRIRTSYLLTLFGLSLLLFFVAEVSAQSTLMMMASSMIVISIIALTIAFSIKMFSVIGKNLLNIREIDK